MPEKAGKWGEKETEDAKMSKYVVIDLEMCNVPGTMRKKYNRRQEIIQIGAVLLDDDLKVESKFNRYVRPEYGYLDDFIKGFTGIRWSDLADAPMLAEALMDFNNWLPAEDVTIVSWSRTDEKQLLNEMEAKGIAFIRIDELFADWLDCQPMFARKLGNTRQYRLQEALVAADILTEGEPHNGLADAYNTALLFAKMMKNDELELNPYYRRFFLGEKDEPLGYSMGDLFAGLNLSGLAVA